MTIGESGENGKNGENAVYGTNGKLAMMNIEATYARATEQNTITLTTKTTLRTTCITSDSRRAVLLIDGTGIGVTYENLVELFLRRAYHVV